MAAEDRDYNLTEEQKAVKAKYPPLCKKYECEYFKILFYLILVHCGCDSAVVRARVIAGNRETRNQCSSSCFSCNFKKKITMEINYLSLTLKTFPLLGHFLAIFLPLMQEETFKSVLVLCVAFFLYSKMIIFAFPHPCNVS